MSADRQSPPTDWTFETKLGLFLLVIYVVTLTMAITYALSTGHAGVIVPPVESTPSAQVSDRVPGLLEAINTYRAGHDLPALELNGELSNSAQAKSDDLVRNEYFAHFRDGQTPWALIKGAGYEYAAAGENLAKCYKTPQAIADAWIASPAHNAILLGDYRQVGFGTAANPDDGCDYVTGHFGRAL